jgi:AcrR family transcriptional regulator
LSYAVCIVNIEYMKKTPYHHGDLEQALLEVGLSEARDSGPRNLGVTYLAKQVNVTPMAVYRHFPNGESLKVSISQLAREELAKRMQSAVAKEVDVKRRFQATGRAYIEFGLDEPGLFAVAFLDCDATPRRYDDPSAWNIFQDAIRDLAEAGYIELEDVQAVTSMAWAVVHGFVVLAGSNTSYLSDTTSAQIDELIERTWRGITAPH